MQIKYISHGLHETGGYWHEKELTGAISGSLKNCDICFREIRFRKNYQGILGWIKLFFLAFFAAKGDIVVTVARLAWPVYLRNLFNKTKIVLVLHNYDPKDNKPQLYYRLLNKFLGVAAKNKVKISLVVVAEYWQNFFQNKFGFSDNIFVFPNLMENAKLRFYRDVVKKKSNLVHLGQWSDKIDKKAYLLLVDALNKIGSVCYFSDNTGVNIPDFPVSYFPNKESYLKQMALSKCTIILNRIDEGWNRVAHESMLVGTPVISTGGGGLTELIKKGNGYLINDIQEIISILKKENLHPIDHEALEQYDISKTQQYSEPISQHLQNK